MLRRGTSRTIVSGNIREMMAAHARKGHIGTSPMESRAKAHTRAVAIAMDKKRRSMRKKHKMIVRGKR